MYCFVHSQYISKELLHKEIIRLLIMPKAGGPLNNACYKEVLVTLNSHCTLAGSFPLVNERRQI
jgi:hypothetical protein